jgi:serine protease Do
MREFAVRNVQVAVLVVAAVGFGMVLAGGLGWTPAGLADDAPGPQAVQAPPANRALPGFAELAEAVGPAVVSIRADSYQTAPQRGGIDPFEFFFGPRRGPRRDPERQSPEPERFNQQSGGSGFVISAEGLIATNNHVVEGADRLTVTLAGRDYPAEVKGTDPETDLAIVQIQAERPLAYLRLGDSEALRVGDWIMAIGSPLGLEQSVSVGVVSAKGRSLGVIDASFENFIQTDAAINFGNSGGPLVNLDGEVVGIATLINYGAENIGFAVPVDTLKRVLPQLRESGHVTRGYLGVEIENLDWPTAQSFGRENTDGALVRSVVEGEPAARAGLRHGDIVVRVDGQPVEDTRGLIDYVSAQPPGSEVRLTIWREGKVSDKTVELGERPGAAAARAEPGRSEGGGIDWLGVRYQELTPALRDTHGLPESAQGVWITHVEVTSPLSDEGVQQGDLVAEVNGQPVAGIGEFEAAVEAAPAGSFLRFYVQRFDAGSGRWTSFFAPVRKP